VPIRDTRVVRPSERTGGQGTTKPEENVSCEKLGFSASENATREDGTITTYDDHDSLGFFPILLAEAVATRSAAENEKKGKARQRPGHRGVTCFGIVSRAWALHIKGDTY
jgi:hypothetical protein